MLNAPSKRVLLLQDQSAIQGTDKKTVNRSRIAICERVVLSYSCSECAGVWREDGVSVEEICNSQEEEVESGDIGRIGEGRASRRRARLRLAAEARRQGTNCIKIGLPGKSILGDYYQEYRTSRKPFLLLRISFPGRPIFIQFPPERARR